MSGLLRRLAGRATSCVFLAYRGIVIRKELGDAETWAGPRRLEVRLLDEIGEDDLAGLLRRAREIPDLDYPGRIERRFRAFAENGYRCFLAMREGALIGYTWLVDSRIPPGSNHPHLIRYGIRLEDRDAFLFETAIAPEHRDGGIATEFLVGVHGALRRMGYGRIHGVVDPENRTARWLYSLLGWEDVRPVTMRRLFLVFLLSDGAWFVRNGPWARPHPYDYRRVTTA